MNAITPSSKYQNLEAILAEVVSSLSIDFSSRAKNGTPITQADADAAVKRATSKIISIVEEIARDIKYLRDHHVRLLQAIDQIAPPAYILNEANLARTRH